MKAPTVDSGFLNLRTCLEPVKLRSALSLNGDCKCRCIVEEVETSELLQGMADMFMSQPARDIQKTLEDQ